jgi:hypothetical protein
MDSTAEFESPRNFCYWGFMSAVAAIVNNNVWLDRHAFILRPNLYILLFGKSGLRKAFPVSIATELVRRVDNTRVLAGRTSIQALVTDLSNVYHRDGKPPITDAIAFISASEFASSLVKDDQALTILTDIYDCRKLWKNTLKSTGTETLKNLNITLLGGINAPHFAAAVGQQNIEGGFVGRTFMIVETKRNCINSLVYPTKWNEERIINHFGGDLLSISNMRGPIEWCPAAQAYYHEWYNEFSRADEVSNETQGVLMRLGDHILKVSILLTLCEGRMTLGVAELEEAIKACSDFSANAKRVTSGEVKADPLAPLVMKVLQFIYEADEQKISKKYLAQRFCSMGVYAAQLDLCIRALNEMGFIFTDSSLHDTYYCMGTEGVGACEELFKGKNK